MLKLKKCEACLKTPIWKYNVLCLVSKACDWLIKGIKKFLVPSSIKEKPIVILKTYTSQTFIQVNSQLQIANGNVLENQVIHGMNCEVKVIQHSQNGADQKHSAIEHCSVSVPFQIHLLNQRFHIIKI